ncbi:ATP-binding protein [Micromonospora sp. HM5-17]|uniref:AlbA family DNA-binding domain-containing protein n=1 Tax=Micromonospora sp. HM5-17 TaxID=2487710 RepID=UPI0018F2894A
MSQPENQWFDRKSFKIQPKDLAKALVAFANAEGGIIAVGITNRSLDGLPSAKQANQLRQAPHEFTDPTTRYEVEIVDIPDPGSHSSSTKGPAQIYLFHVSPNRERPLHNRRRVLPKGWGPNTEAQSR